MTRLRIALHGYAGVGKDEVGKILVAKYGLTRVAFGDIIKADLDALAREHLGFSAFTQDREQKARIRELLVHWGYTNYESIERRFFSTLPEQAVNTRIFRARECEQWRARGGVVIEVTRLGTGPAEPNEERELAECFRLGLIDDTIANDGSLADLERQVDELVYFLSGRHP